MKPTGFNLTLLTPGEKPIPYIWWRRKSSRRLATQQAFLWSTDVFTIIANKCYSVHTESLQVTGSVIAATTGKNFLSLVFLLGTPLPIQRASVAWCLHDQQELDVSEKLTSTKEFRSRGFNNQLFSLWTRALPLSYFAIFQSIIANCCFITVSLSPIQCTIQLSKLSAVFY